MPFALPATRSSASRTGRSMSRCTASMRYPVQHEIADWDSIPSRRINGGSRAEATRSIPGTRISTRLFPPVQTAPAFPRAPHGAIVSGHMISRRWFLGGSIALLAAPLAAEAQQAAKVYRIGVILTSAPNESGHLIKALEEGMRELGYVDERNIV